MQVKSINDPAFKKYGRVLQISIPDLLERLAKTPVTNGVEYFPSVPELEECVERQLIVDSVYGGMPIQIGFCNGVNHILNAVEYHRDSEINVICNGATLVVGSLQDIEDDFTYETAKMEAFEAPAGTVVEVYATTLHYAPMNAAGQDDFRVAIILPKGTNTDAPALTGVFAEDKLMTARNKWLICHPDAPEAKNGAFAGLKGENLTVG